MRAAIARKVAELRRKVAAVKARLAIAGAVGALPLARETAAAAVALGYAPLEAEALEALGSALERRGDLAAAERTLQDAAFAALAGRNDMALAETMVLLAGTVGKDRSRSEDGARVLSHAAAVVSRLGDRRLYAELELTRSQLRLERGDARGAYSALAGLVPHVESTYGADHPMLARALAELSRAAFRMGRPLEARSHAEAALRILEATVPPDHPSLRGARDALAATRAVRTAGWP
jgi:hypothetical protein